MGRPASFPSGAMQMPEGTGFPSLADAIEIPEGMEKSEPVTPPEGAKPPEGMEPPAMPEGAAPPEKPNGGMHPDKEQFQQSTAAEASEIFTFVNGGNHFRVIG